MELPKVTRHRAEDGTIFQVHHTGVNPEIDPLAEVGKVFRELPDGRALFSGGCARRILQLPDAGDCAKGCQAEELFKDSLIDREKALDALFIPAQDEIKERMKKAKGDK